MDPFFTIDKQTTRRTTRRWSDPVRDLTMPVHGTGSDRPELIQSIGSFNKAESSTFEDFLDSRKANSGDDEWDLHKVESEFNLCVGRGLRRRHQLAFRRSARRSKGGA